MNIQKYVLFILPLAFLIQSCSTDHFTQMDNSKLDRSKRIENENVTLAHKQSEEEPPPQSKPSALQKAKDEDSTKTIESKKIAFSAKRDFANKVLSTWHMPVAPSGQKASARVTLTENGAISSIVVNASDLALRKSVEHAIRNAAPFPMPSDPDARREARSFTAHFTVK
ncbi:TonB C-terminal domain-containing protein [Acinetobacter sp. Marseille-Q1618]|uniref:TonB C-terminal domain-containing protein n=1 Tax=Acinetobacter sp. Marseille-Q1618 TaxID=2697502 RepID=UPI0020C25383|nr:TonB C-terminal domain-containing protein [Acinetobacter sp. Marseille-Q1618]